MKTRKQIIADMCLTMRHDFGVAHDTTRDALPAGMTPDQRQALWNQMAQVFDNVIAPNMEFSAQPGVAPVSTANWSEP